MEQPQESLVQNVEKLLDEGAEAAQHSRQKWRKFETRRSILRAAFHALADAEMPDDIATLVARLGDGQGDHQLSKGERLLAAAALSYRDGKSQLSLKDLARHANIRQDTIRKYFASGGAAYGSLEQIQNDLEGHLVRIADVSRWAGVSEGSIYVHFGGKEQLINEARDLWRMAGKLGGVVLDLELDPHDAVAVPRGSNGPSSGPVSPDVAGTGRLPPTAGTSERSRGIEENTFARLAAFPNDIPSVAEVRKGRANPGDLSGGAPSAGMPDTRDAGRGDGRRRRRAFAAGPPPAALPAQSSAPPQPLRVTQEWSDRIRASVRSKGLKITKLGDEQMSQPRSYDAVHSWLSGRTFPPLDAMRDFEQVLGYPLVEQLVDLKLVDGSSLVNLMERMIELELVDKRELRRIVR